MLNACRAKRAARVLRAGGLIIYPTEGVLGLGCDPFQPAAVRRLLALKRRPARMGFILIASTFDQIRSLVGPLPEVTLQAVLESWPGPVTWVLPAATRVPSWLTGGRSTLALRISAHPLARAICTAFRAPIVSTSANLSGRSPARHIRALPRTLRTRVDYVVPGRIGKGRGPTEIRDAVRGTVLRNPGQ